MIFLLAIVLVVGSCRSSYAERIIQIPALSKSGFVGTLGGLYSRADDAVIPGISLYSGGRIPVADITMSSLGETSCRSEIVHDEVEKNIAAGLTADMELSIYSGSVSLTGSSKVFNEFSVSDENVNAVLTYEHRSFQELVDMDSADKSVLSSAKAERYHASHVITGIEWGCRVLTTLEIKIGTGMNRSKFESDVNVELGFLSSRLEARGNREIENLTLLSKSEYKMALYSDIMLNKTVPRSLEEMIEIVNSVPEAIKTSYGRKGARRFYILTPISDILMDDDLCNPEQNLTATELTVKEDFMLRFNVRSTFFLNGEIKRLYSDLVKDYENYDFIVHPRSVLTLSSLYLNYSSVYTNIFLPKIRTIIRNSKMSKTDKHPSEIPEVASWYKLHPFGAEATVEDLRYLWKIMKNKINYNSIINQNGAKFLKQEGTIPQVLLRNRKTDVFILLIPNDPNVTHTAGDITNGVMKSSRTDPYDTWGYKLHSLFVLTGAKYVADCRFEEIPQCQNLRSAVILHYKRGLLISRNRMIHALEQWNSKEVDRNMMEDIESFDEYLPDGILG